MRPSIQLIVIVWMIWTRICAMETTSLKKSYSRYDHHDYGYSQSYDGFHDEQNDYDMMDDDF